MPVIGRHRPPLRARANAGPPQPQLPPVPPPPPLPNAPVITPQMTHEHVVYSPFAADPTYVPGDGSAANQAKRPLGTSWEPHAKYLVVRHGDSAQPLRSVSHLTTLYVVAHCSPGSDHVSDNAGNQLTAAELAERLRQDGLTYSIKRVKLYACSGACPSNHRESFAAELLREMRRVGFAFVQLIGYDKTVSSVGADGHKQAKEIRYDFVGGNYFYVSIGRAKSAQVLNPNV